MLHSHALTSILVLLLPSPAAALRTAVLGATGRVGSLVVRRLLQEGHSVTAVVRSLDKAAEVLPESAALELRALDLVDATPQSMREACDEVDACIWCASGFGPSGEPLDVKGMQLLPSGRFSTNAKTPAIVMLSSAGVTRPAWDEAKKARLIGAADIPIIRLNPGGILGHKVTAEQLLRDSGLPYTVVRPTGLKFEGWPRGRPVLSQGDVAVGRTNPDDLAEVLVATLSEPAAAGKTFEMFTLAGYPPPRTLGPALERLRADSGPPLEEAAVEASYAALQQCLPGEEQDATKLEMGRTYEQVDAGEVAARERGAASTAREQELASRVAQPVGGGRQAGIRGMLTKIFSSK